MSTLVVEISREGDKLKMGAFERSKGIDVTLKHYSECTASNKETGSLCEEMTAIFNKAVHNKESGDNFADELKKNGRALFDQLLTVEVKKVIKNTKSNFLLISIDEHLVQIPWELLHDGEEFLCIRFAMGRNVKTKQKGYENKLRDVSAPIKMLVVADPTGDLNSAYEEGIAIRNELDKRKNKVKVLSKTGEVYADFIKRNIRDYDIMHFAGHADYNSINPSDSGWVLKDGKLTAKDIVVLGATAPMPSIVFSNACQSGKTQEWIVNREFEDEIYGLANAFLLAGVRHYVGTFWRVLDKTCLDFANEFYKNATDGLPVGEAIRLARMRLVNKHGYSSIIWSSYMLYGDPSAGMLTHSLQKKRNIHFRRLIVLAVGLFIAAASAIVIMGKSKPLSILVFPFENLDENNIDWGFSHTIVDNLGRIPQLNIIDIRTVVSPNDLKQKTPKQICSSLEVNLIVKGEYRREKNNLKANLRLENPMTGRILTTSEVLAEDEIGLLNKIARSVVEMLNVRIANRDKNKLKVISTTNAAAYKLFAQTWDLYLSGNNSEAIELCKRALELDPEYLDVYKRLGNIYDVMGNRETALSYYLEYARLSEMKSDLANLANAFINIGWIYQSDGSYDKANNFYNKGIIKSIEAGDKLYEAKAYRQLASWYRDKGEIDKAYSLLLKSSKINQENIHNYDHKYNLACDFQELGFIFVDKNKLDKALKYFISSIRLFEALGAKKQARWAMERVSDKISDNYTGLGNVFLEKKDYPQALVYYQKGLEIDKVIGWQEGLAGDYRCIGDVYFEKGDFDRALVFYSKSFDLFSRIQDEVGLAGVYKSIGLVHIKKGNWQKALDYLDKALPIYEKAGLSETDEVRQNIEDIRKHIK